MKWYTVLTWVALLLGTTVIAQTPVKPDPYKTGQAIADARSLKRRRDCGELLGQGSYLGLNVFKVAIDILMAVRIIDADTPLYNHHPRCEIISMVAVETKPPDIIGLARFRHMTDVVATHIGIGKSTVDL